MDASDADVIAGVRDDEAAKDRLAVAAVMLQDELGEGGLDLFGGDDVTAHAPDVSFGCLHETLHQFRLGRKDIGLVGKDVRCVREGNVFQRRRGEPVQVIATLMILTESYQLGFFVG
jgi:hypothetical protein